MNPVSALAVTALLAIGPGNSSKPCHAQPARAGRHVPPASSAPVTTATPVPSPGTASTWLDYIDLRLGSGDELAKAGRHALAEARTRPQTPDT
jgi:hypothetical protein